MAVTKTDKARVNKKRWAAYAAAGVAATCLGTQTAEADITHVVVGSGAGDWTADDDMYFLLEGSASLNFFHPGGVALLGIANNAAATFTLDGSVAGFSSGGFLYAANLASGENISTQGFLGNNFATMAFNGGYTNSEFVDTSGIAAFTFDIGSGAQFGWVRMTALGDSPTNSYVIEEYAFGDAGEAVATGQITSVPEPTSLGLLALGAIGVMASRRRKKSVA